MRTFDLNRVFLTDAWEKKQSGETVWYFEVPTDWLETEHNGAQCAMVKLHQPMGDTATGDCRAEIAPVYCNETDGSFTEGEYTGIKLNDNEITAMLTLTRA